MTFKNGIIACEPEMADRNHKMCCVLIQHSALWFTSCWNHRYMSLCVMWIIWHGRMTHQTPQQMIVPISVHCHLFSAAQYMMIQCCISFVLVSETHTCTPSGQWKHGILRTCALLRRYPPHDWLSISVHVCALKCIISETLWDYFVPCFD